MEQTRLESLLIAEVSGVDDPANQSPGWMVTKSVDAAPNLVAKIKGIVLGAPANGKDAFDMERDELVTILTETNKSLVEAVAEAVSKSLAPAEGAGAAATEAPVAAEAVAPLTAEDVQKTVVEAIEEHVVKVYNELIEKVLDRLEATEKALGFVARKSLEGQETEAAAEGTVEKTAPKTPDLGDAIAAAFKR